MYNSMYPVVDNIEDADLCFDLDQYEDYFDENINSVGFILLCVIIANFLNESILF